MNKLSPIHYGESLLIMDSDVIKLYNLCRIHKSCVPWFLETTFSMNTKSHAYPGKQGTQDKPNKIRSF